MHRLTRVLVTAGAVCALAVTAHSTAGAVPKRGGAATTDEVLVAMQRDLGLSATQAKALRGQQDKAVKLDAGLRDSLGETRGACAQRVTLRRHRRRFEERSIPVRCDRAR